MRRTTLGIALLLFIAQLTLIESAKAAPILPAGMYLANSITPSAGGAPTANLCRNGWVITQLLVSKVEPNPYLPGFQFRCSPITITGKVGEATDLHIVVNAGVTQSDYNLFKCPEGEALVGLGAYTEQYVKDVGGTCAKPFPYKLGKEGSLGIGFEWPLSSRSYCTETPYGAQISTFMTGIYSFAAAGVDSIQSICKNFEFHEAPRKPLDVIFDFQDGILRAASHLDLASQDLVTGVTLESSCLQRTDKDALEGEIAGDIAFFVLDLPNIKDCIGTQLLIRSKTNFTESESLEVKLVVPTFNLTAKSLIPSFSYADSKVNLIFQIDGLLKKNVREMKLILECSSLTDKSGLIGDYSSSQVLFSISPEDFTSCMGKAFTIQGFSNVSEEILTSQNLGNSISYENTQLKNPIISTKKNITNIEYSVPSVSVGKIEKSILLITGKAFSGVIKNSKSKAVTINFNIGKSPKGQKIKTDLWIFNSSHPLSKYMVKLNFPKS